MTITHDDIAKIRNAVGDGYHDRDDYPSYNVDLYRDRYDFEKYIYRVMKDMATKAERAS